MTKHNVADAVASFKPIEAPSGSTFTFITTAPKPLFTASRTLSKETKANLGSLHTTLDAAGVPFVQVGKLRLYRTADLEALVTTPKVTKPTKTVAKVDASNDDIARANGFAIGGGK